MKLLKRTRQTLAAAAVALLLCFTFARADHKPGHNPGGGGGGGGGGESDPYVLVDLLGVPNLEPDGSTSYLSTAGSVTEIDPDGTVLVTGHSHLHPQQSNHPVNWYVNADGTFSLADLGLPPGAADASVADVNDFGDVVVNAWGGSETSYVLMSGGTWQALLDDTEVRAINNLSEAIGGSDFNGYFWSLDADGQVTATIFPGTFQPNDINDQGVMVGEWQGFAAAAWFDANNELQVEALTDTLNSTATAISENGELVVGTISSFDGNAWFSEAFVWTDSTGVVGLGTLEGSGSSYATGVNSAGQVVGWSDVKGKIGQAGFLYQNGQMSNLNKLVSTGGKTLRFANDINDAGHIVGDLVNSRSGGETHGFLLIPNTP